MILKLLNAFLILLLALAAEVGIQSITGVSLGLAWAALMTAAFFLDIGALLLLVVFAAGILNGAPGSSFEMAFFIIAPVVTWGLRHSLQLKPFFGALFVVACATAAFYGVFGSEFVAAHPGVMALDLAVSVSFGALSFWLLEFSTSAT